MFSTKIVLNIDKISIEWLLKYIQIENTVIIFHNICLIVFLVFGLKYWTVVYFINHNTIQKSNRYAMQNYFLISIFVLFSRKQTNI